MRTLNRRWRRSAGAALLWFAAAVPAFAQVDPDRLSAMKARNVGPAGMSGRIAAIAAVPGDPPTIYVGAATGGLWRSADGGVTWTPLFDDQPTASIGAIAVSPANPDLIWVGTGESNLRNSAGVGNGVYKSVDGGRTWTRVGLERSEHIEDIVLHPTNPDIAYVAALGPAWSDGGQRGVYRTTDGGETWERVLHGNERTGASAIVMDPRNPDKLFASLWEFRRWPWFFESGGEGSGLYVTYDGGETWTQYTEEDGLPPGELGRIAVAVAPSDPDVVYALVEAKTSQLLRSDDGGRTWRTMRKGPNVADRPFYYSEIRVDPANENRLYNLGSVLRVSEDGGKSFTTLVGWDVHPDHHDLWIDPTDPDFLVDGNDGGVYLSYDRGKSWRFVENLPLAQFYHINVDMETPFNIYGGLQDNGSWRGPSHTWASGPIRNHDWTEVGFGDGFATLDDPSSPHYGYSMSQGGNLMRFDLRTGERKNIRPWGPDSVELRFNWNAAIAMDPFDRKTVYYGSQFVHKSTDRGDTWEIISPDLTTNDSTKQRQHLSGGLTRDVTAAENFTTIMTIAPSPVERGVLWVGTDDGNVQLTRDGGETWTNVVENIDVPEGTWVPHIEPSKHHGGTAFVVFDDHRRGNWETYVFKTTNYGEDWESIATDEIEGFVHVIEQDPVEPDLLYVGTEVGMYVSLNGGERWFKWTHGLPTVPVRALIVHPRDHDLVIGTYGRAAYVLDDVRPLRALARDPSLLEQPVHLFDVPPAYQHAGRQIIESRFIAHAEFEGDNRPYGALLTYALAAGSDSTEVEIKVLDDGGRVIRSFTGPGKAGLNRVAWNLRRDGVRGPSRERDRDEDDVLPAGAPVLPGTYTVRIRAGEHEASGTVEVRPDPRVEFDRVAWQEKLDALGSVEEKIRTITRTVDRLLATTEAVETVLEHIEDREDSAFVALRDSGRALRDTLSGLTDRFVPPTGRQGIYDRSATVTAKINQVYWSMSSSRDAPTQAERIYLRQAEAALDTALADVERVFAEDVAAFRRQVEAAGFTLFPDDDRAVSMTGTTDGTVGGGVH